jgi:hypothetical protein
MFAGKLKQLRRPASSEPASLEGGLGKAKPSMVASAVSGSFPFFIHTRWKRTVLLEEVQTFRFDFRTKLRPDGPFLAIAILKKI